MHAADRDNAAEKSSHCVFFRWQFNFETLFNQTDRQSFPLLLLTLYPFLTSLIILISYASFFSMFFHTLHFNYWFSIIVLMGSFRILIGRYWFLFVRILIPLLLKDNKSAYVIATLISNGSSIWYEKIYFFFYSVLPSPPWKGLKVGLAPVSKKKKKKNLTRTHTHI